MHLVTSVFCSHSTVKMKMKQVPLCLLNLLEIESCLIRTVCPLSAAVAGSSDKRVYFSSTENCISTKTSGDKNRAADERGSGRGREAENRKTNPCD